MNETTTRLQVLGGGKMGQALIGGMIDAGWAEVAELAVVEVAEAQQAALADQFDGITVLDRPLDGVDALIAVKPHLVIPVCRDLVGVKRVVSVAAGITTAAIEAAMGESVAVVRVMPNTPALVGAGAAGLAAGSAATDDDVDWAVGILGSVGRAEVVAEKLIDAVTGVSGSGPAYVFLLAEALTDAGVAQGLPRTTAAALAAQTIYGAGKLMMESGSDPVELRAAVTTPAGTTAAGLGALEEGGLRATVARAVKAATERSIELGRADA